MRTSCQLALLALAAVAVLAPVASSAQNEGFLIREEDYAGHHCLIVSGPADGGCKVRLAGEGSFVGHAFGIEAIVSDCNLDLEARLDEDGEGYAYAGRFTGDASHVCARRICDLPWPIGRVRVDPRRNGLLIRFELCEQASSGLSSRCSVEVPIVDRGDHEYEIPLDPAIRGVPRDGGQSCELRGGELRIETGDPDFDPPLDPHSEIEVIR